MHDGNSSIKENKSIIDNIIDEDNRTRKDQSIQDKSIEKDRSIIKINVTRSMLRILNILENSENFEKLETDDEIIKQQPAKNTINSHIICFNSSIYSTTKKNNQEMLEK